MVLPAPMRLRGHRCFNRLHRRGRRLDGEHMVLRFVQAEPRLLNPVLQRWERQAPESCRCRCAVVISNKVSKRSVVRNKLRRRLHEHLRRRLEQAAEQGDQWLLISLRPGVQLLEAPLLEECDRLLKNAGLLP